MIFAEEPIIRAETQNGIQTVKFSRNAMKVFLGDVFVQRIEIPRLNAENLRDYLIQNRNRGMIEMFRNEAQTSIISQLVADMIGGYIIQQNPEQRGVYSPRWIYAKYVFHWLLKHYLPDHPPDHGVPCYIPDEEDDYSRDAQAATTINYPRRNLLDRAEGPDNQFYFLSWEGDKRAKLVVTRDLLCGEKPAIVGEIPIVGIEEEFQIKFLKSERRKAARALLANPGNQEALQNLYFLHNLLLPFIFYNEFVGHENSQERLLNLLANNIFANVL
jgi:hypothetical protein